MRLVVIDDINRQNITEETESERQFFHGGIIGIQELTSIASSKGLEVVYYYSGFKFLADDVVFFSDRHLTHFYDGWKLLKNNGMLRRTIAALIESDVVDRKCSKRVLKRIKGAFPFFLTYHDDLIDNKKFFKIWPTISINKEIIEKKASWENLDLITMIATKQVISESRGEKYSERIRIVDWFETHPEFSFKVYGRNWDGYRVNGGVIKYKSDAYGKSRFAFCLENCRRNGYITEKIFDCFYNGVVPVYLGANNINRYIPDGCYIDYSRFKSIAELVKYLQSISAKEYDLYLNNIKTFVMGDLSEYSETKLFDRIADIERLMPINYKPTMISKVIMFADIMLYERYVYYKRLIRKRIKSRKYDK